MAVFITAKSDLTFLSTVLQQIVATTQSLDKYHVTVRRQLNKFLLDTYNEMALGGFPKVQSYNVLVIELLY